MDPMRLAQFGMLASAMPMTQPLGAAAMKAAQLQAQYDPALATRMAVAKSALTQDQAMMAAAQQSGNPLAYKAAQMKFLKDAAMVNVAAYNGAITTTGGLTPAEIGASTVNPVQGVMTRNGVEMPIPGAAPTQQALAAARALGEAQGKVADVGGVPIPLTAALGSQGGGASPTSPGNQFLHLLGQARYTSDTAAQSADLGKLYQEGADAAKTTNYALDQMIQDAKQASLGPAAGAKEWMEKKGAGLAQLLGVKVATPQLDSYQELDKYGNQVAFAAARQMGSREAAQVVQLQMESNPNKSLTPAAFADLAGSMKAMNNYVIAKNVAVQQIAQTNGGNLELASAQWNRSVDPRVWDLTLSPHMGEKWAATIGKNKIEAAWQYLTPDEQQALVQNIPMGLRKKWLK